MKNPSLKVLITLVTLFLNFQILANNSNVKTSSLNLSPSEILIAETHQDDPLSVQSMIYIRNKDGNKKTLSIPSEISQREIVGLFPNSPYKAWVVSQWVIETGDKPLVSEIDTRTGEWKNITEVDCIAHRKIVPKENGLEFQCLEDDVIEGKYIEKIKNKFVNLR